MQLIPIKYRPVRGFLCFLPFIVGIFLGGRLHAATAEEMKERQEAAKIQPKDISIEDIKTDSLSKYGTLALQILGSDCKHASSEHFIVHYEAPALRDRLIREAEFYYWKIKNDLKLGEDLVTHPSHIFVFQKSADWQKFQAQADILDILGVTYGNEFFTYYSKDKDQESAAVVAHEMTHLVFNRFFKGQPPLWLNEGFAECQAENAYYALYTKAKRPREVNPSIDPSRIDLQTLTSLQAYPQDLKMRSAFYLKSELAVRVLMTKGGMENFAPFVNNLIDQKDFNTAFNECYIKTLKSPAEFIKELGRVEKRFNLKNR